MKGMASVRRASGGAGRVLCAVVSLLATASACLAEEWQFVEVAVSLRPDGKATIVYQVAIDPKGMELHGFYFEGFSETPHFDQAQCFAEDAQGKRHNLDIKTVGHRKLDVILANGAAVRAGRVVYTLTYGADLCESKNLAQTRANDGRDLAVFNWSPAQWDSPLGHYTVTIHWPIELPNEAATREELSRKILTENWMNSSYKMDYRARKHDDKFWLMQLIHWEKVAAKGHFRIQEYVDASLFNWPAPAQPPPNPPTQAPAHVEAPKPVSPVAPPPAVPPSRSGRTVDAAKLGHVAGMVVLLALLAAVFFFVVAGKHRSMLKAADGLPDISWVDQDWTPPKIVMTTFRKAGKIPTLTDLEAALFIGLPVNSILSIMLRALERQGVVRLHDDGRIERLKDPSGLDESMMLLLNAVQPDGKLDPGKTQSLIQRMIDALRRKTWDADVDATQRHYVAQYKAVFEQVSAQKKTAGSQDLDDNNFFPYYLYYNYGFLSGSGSDAASHSAASPVVNPAVQNNIAVATGFKGPDSDYKHFMDNPACYQGCLVHSACHDACHSACHSACHDACHSACHSACHDACHSACHSACVSGGAH